MKLTKHISRQYLTDTYGSRRGFMLTVWHRIMYYLGKYRGYRRIDWNSVDRLVFVCKGNICRSAFAEAVARASGMDAVSCGISTIMEASANARAAAAAGRLGYSLAKHKTLPVMYLVLKGNDLIIAMEPWQVEYLDTHLERNHMYTLLGLWQQPVCPHIQDPYGATDIYFANCFKYIEKSVHEIVAQVKNRRNRD